jgi:hypothetical protein
MECCALGKIRLPSEGEDYRQSRVDATAAHHGMAASEVKFNQNLREIGRLA